MAFYSAINYKLALSCFYVWISMFSLIILAIEVTNISVLIILIAGSACMFWLISIYSIPPPKASTIQEIFGKELKAEFFCFNSFNLVPNVDDPEVFTLKVIAHRFAGIEGPENSLEALDLCHKNGAVAVEFDLVLTADLIPVVFHDSTLDRVTDAIGEIKSKTWSELKDLDISVKHPFHKEFEGARIPLFDDIIQKCLEYDLRLFIDVKDDRPEVINVILSTYEKYPKMYKRSVVSSFNGVLLYNIRRENPNIVVSMAWRPYYMSHRKYSVIKEECIPYSKFYLSFLVSRFMDIITTWLLNNVAHELIGLSAVLIHKDALTPEAVLFWKAKNVRAFAWTVNNHIEKLHLSNNLGVGYFTDTMLGH